MNLRQYFGGAKIDFDINLITKSQKNSMTAYRSIKLCNALKNNVLVSYCIPGTDQLPSPSSAPETLTIKFNTVAIKLLLFLSPYPSDNIVHKIYSSQIFIP